MDKQEAEMVVRDAARRLVLIIDGPLADSFDGENDPGPKRARRIRQALETLEAEVPPDGQALAQIATEEVQALHFIKGPEFSRIDAIYNTRQRYLAQYHLTPSLKDVHIAVKMAIKDLDLGW